MKLDWRGEIIVSKYQAATIIAVNQTMGEAVAVARRMVRVKTSTLQGSIRMKSAVKKRGGVSGEWGSFDVNYALWQEIGTKVMQGKPYLRPAADFQYRFLGRRIRTANAAMGV